MFLQFCLVTHTVLHSFPHLPSYLCLGPCLLPSHLFLWKLSVYLSMTKPIHLFTRPPLNYTKMITPQQIAILYPASSFPPCYIIYISTLARTNKYHTVFFKVRKKKEKRIPRHQLTPIYPLAGLISLLFIRAKSLLQVLPLLTTSNFSPFFS